MNSISLWFMSTGDDRVVKALTRISSSSKANSSRSFLRLNTFLSLTKVHKRDENRNPDIELSSVFRILGHAV